MCAHLYLVEGTPRFLTNRHCSPIVCIGPNNLLSSSRRIALPRPSVVRAGLYEQHDFATNACGTECPIVCSLCVIPPRHGATGPYQHHTDPARLPPIWPAHASDTFRCLDGRRRDRSCDATHLARAIGLSDTPAAYAKCQRDAHCVCVREQHLDRGPRRRVSTTTHQLSGIDAKS